MKLRILLLLTQCICFKTNYGEEHIQSSCGEMVKEEKIGSSCKEKDKKEKIQSSSPENDKEETNIGSSFEEEDKMENIESSFEKRLKADFFRDAAFSDPRHLKTSSPRKIHIGASMRIIKVYDLIFERGEPRISFQDNNEDDETRDFDDGFKHSVKVLFQSLLRLSTGLYLQHHHHIRHRRRHHHYHHRQSSYLCNTRCFSALDHPDGRLSTRVSKQPAEERDHRAPHQEPRSHLLGQVCQNDQSRRSRFFFSLKIFLCLHLVMLNTISFNLLIVVVSKGLLVVIRMILLQV